MSNTPEVVNMGSIDANSDIGRMLTEVLGGRAPGGNKKPAPPTTEEALEALADRCRNYVKSYGVNEASDCPYKVGDFVTPRQGVALKGQGNPHVILESRPAAPDFGICDETTPSSNTYGSRRDVRVAGYSNGTLVAHWMESYELEPFTVNPAPGADSGTA